MVNINEDKLIISYQLEGQYFKERGKYTSSKTLEKKDKKGNIVDTTHVGSKTLVEPKYEYATKTIILGKPFLEGCLPKKRNDTPKIKGKAWTRWLNSTEGKLWKEHNKLSDEDKIRLNVESYVYDITNGNGHLISYEII